MGVSLVFVPKISTIAHNYSNNAFRLKAERAGSLEYYTTKEGFNAVEVLWEGSFIETLDKFLLNPLSVNKSLRLRIQEFLDHQDKWLNKEFNSSAHYENILESLDALFLQTTKDRINGGK